MATLFKLSDLILGREVNSSRSEFKRLMLTGYLAVLCMIVAIIYTFFDLANEVNYALAAYALLFLISLGSIFLIRFKKYKIAKINLISSINLVVFWFAINDPFETGVFLLFIPAGIGAFSIFDFDDLKTSLGMTALTVVLFLIAYFGDIHVMEVGRPSEAYIQGSFVFNYFISLTISVLAVYFLMSLNRQSENDLIQKELFVSQKNAELQKVNEALDRFVYSVSHDLRSPLSSILGLINLANLTKDPDELAQIMKLIQGRVLAQDNFIREIIDYSRNTRTDTVLEPIALRQLVCEVIDALKFDSLADKIVFKVQVPDDLVISSDRIRLTVILSNLIGNGIKYHDFSKSSPYIMIGYHADRCCLYVEDNGTGVMSEHKEKIFNMFYRGSDRVTGSGLGLFITKEAVNKLGGKIELKSEYEQGSTFSVILPQPKK